MFSNYCYLYRCDQDVIRNNKRVLSSGRFLRIQSKLIFANVIRCSRLQPRVGYFICFKFTPVLLKYFFMDALFLINRLRKEINRLISKGVSNIYLEVTATGFEPTTT